MISVNTPSLVVCDFALRSIPFSLQMLLPFILQQYYTIYTTSSSNTFNFIEKNAFVLVHCA